MHTEWQKEGNADQVLVENVKVVQRNVTSVHQTHQQTHIVSHQPGVKKASIGLASYVPSPFLQMPLSAELVRSSLSGTQAKMTLFPDGYQRRKEQSLVATVW